MEYISNKLNLDAVKLPFNSIDYIIVHELFYTKIKNHSKDFNAELSKHIPIWKNCNKKCMG